MTARDELLMRALQSIEATAAALRAVLEQEPATSAGDDGRLTIAQAAARLGIDESTVRRLVRAKQLRAVKHGRRRGYRVPMDALEEYERRHTTGGPRRAAA